MSSSGHGADASLLAGTEWRAEAIGGEPVAAGVEITVAFGADGRVSGSAGVNRLMGTYTVRRDEMHLRALATTRMAGPPAAMAEERRFLAAFEGTRSFRVAGDQLTLEGAGRRLHLRRLGRAIASVRGTVLYRERLPMPGGAVVSVRLLDVSRADAPSVTVAEQAIDSPGNVPVAFALDYDPAAIDPRATYSVSARIERGDELLWISDTHNPVLTRGAPDRVDVVVVRVGA